MPVAIRKRSWEEHVTHPSGLQYSYDDLDLVCCHGVEGDGLWMGSAGSKQGRRARCSSMPEGCHQLPIDDPAQTCERGASVMNDDTEPEHLKLMENNGKDLQESVDRSYELHNVEMLAESRPQGEKSAQAESSAKKGHVRPIESSDVSVINQCCSLMADSNVSSKQMNSGHAGDAIGTNTTQCADKDVKVSVSQSLGNTDQSLAPVSEDLAIPHQTEYSCSKLDTIPEISPVEAKDSSLLHAQKNNDVNSTPNPAAERCCLDDKHEVAEQHTQNLPPCSTEVNEGLHGNRASGPHFSESPASEVADGHREHHQPGATMEASREDVRSVIYNDTQDGSSALDGTYEHADQKEDNVFKVRLRKVRINIQKLNGCTITSLLHRGHARLDSMVLLLMKLDQLDQEIENALIATSSMDSTATFHRRHHPVPTQLSYLAGCDSRSPQALGAKPKSGVSQHPNVYRNQNKVPDSN
uniref:Uncharacterized protein n=1 Tax=Neolamprologus brichardi TaxID=32507 RepID=A0A3Q4MTQ1_NEOBR